MKNYQIINIINCFSKDEVMEFKRYLHCSYFNTDKSLSEIYSVLLKYRDKTGCNVIRKIKFKLAAKTKYDIKTIANKLSLLANEALDFVKVISITKDTQKTNLFLENWLIEKDLVNLFLKRLSNIKKGKPDNEKCTSHIDEEYFHYLFLHEVNVLNYMVISGKYESSKSNAGLVTNLNNSAEYLYIYFVMQFISIYANYIFQLVDKGGKADKRFLFCKNFLSKIFSEKPVFSSKFNNEVYFLYRNLYLLLTDYNNENAYRKYKNSITNFGNRNITHLYKYHLSVLTNFSTMMTRLGIRVKYFKNEALLSRYIYIKKEYFDGTGLKTMSPAEYRNFVIDCANIGNYNCLNDFIKECTSRLVKKDVEKMKAFALAFYYFGLKEYSKSKKLLSTLNLNKFLYRYDLIHLRLKIYYENKEIELFNSDLHNYEGKIKSDKMLTFYDRNSYAKPVKFLRKLVNIYVDNNIESRAFDSAKLKNELSGIEQSFMMKKWINEKVDEIIMKIETKKYGKYIAS